MGSQLAACSSIAVSATATGCSISTLPNLARWITSPGDVRYHRCPPCGVTAAAVSAPCSAVSRCQLARPPPVKIDRDKPARPARHHGNVRPWQCDHRCSILRVSLVAPWNLTGSRGCSCEACQVGVGHWVVGVLGYAPGIVGGARCVDGWGCSLVACECTRSARPGRSRTVAPTALLYRPPASFAIACFTCAWPAHTGGDAALNGPPGLALAIVRNVSALLGGGQERLFGIGAVQLAPCDKPAEAERCGV
jgi:hypothetical protein